MAPWRGFVLWLLGFPALAIAGLFKSALSLLAFGVGLVLLPAAAAVMRKLANHYRRRVGEWTGHRIQRPYYTSETDWTSPRIDALPGWARRFVRTAADPATWRDWFFLQLDPFVAMVTAALPALLILYGFWGWMLSLWAGSVLATHGVSEWYTFIHVTEGYPDSPLRVAGTAVLGTAFVGAGFLLGPKMLDVYGRWAGWLLGPTEKAKLALRVQHLTETRSDVVDTSAAELRRIERDLHDGAQARLVAMGMTLGAIEHLLDRDPEKARLLLAETRASSARALAELRDLVRGIHPPVLADRGVGDAVKAIALDHPMPVEVTVDVPGRPEPPVESAVYFAVCEMLTNVAKHAGARRAWVELVHRDGMLRATVTDDGAGGATMDGGTGLRGVERRIGAFDGVLALSSPPGGPTIVTLEVPCTLQAPPSPPPS